MDAITLRSVALKYVVRILKLKLIETMIVIYCLLYTAHPAY